MEKEKFLEILNKKVEEANVLHRQIIHHQEGYENQKQKDAQAYKEFNEIRSFLEEVHEYIEEKKAEYERISLALKSGAVTRDKRGTRKLLKEIKEQIEVAREIYAGKLEVYDELKDNEITQRGYLNTLKLNLDAHINRLEITLFQINSLLDASGYAFTPLSIKDFTNKDKTFKTERAIFPYGFTESGLEQTSPQEDENE